MAADMAGFLLSPIAALNENFPEKIRLKSLVEPVSLLVAACVADDHRDLNVPHIAAQPT